VNNLSGILVTLSIASFLISCSQEGGFGVKSVLPEGEIRGEFLSADENKSTIKIKSLAMGPDLTDKFSGSLNQELELVVQPGDLALLQNNKIFRGKLQETFSGSLGKSFLLHYIWPDDRAERIRLNNVNRLLRRDTLSMGQDVIRTVGDQVPPFALYDQDGRVLTSEYFDGSITVLNFIFTRCSVSDMCPASTRKMKKLQELSSQKKIPFIQFLSVSLDSEFDSPGVLKTYARGYGLSEANFKLGTARKTVIDDITRQLGISRKKEDGQPLDHTMRTMIINAKRQIVYQVPGKSWSVKDFFSRLQPDNG
jgi:protein SCO1